MTAVIVKYLQQFKWGSWSLISLYISLVSGIIVGLQYDFSQPYFSVSSLDLLVPYGEYFRSLHFYSSQAFFLFACAHLVLAYPKADDYSFSSWAMLVLTLPIGLLLLFTGYVLRADNTGYSAGMIAESILHTLPIIGTTLDNLLFSISNHGMQRVYLHHVISLDLLLLVVGWQHLRKYQVRFTDHIPFTCLTLILCMIIIAPLEPEIPGASYISGPWFFLGLQELLRYFHPLLAGVLFPLTFLAALIFLRKQYKLFPSLLRFVWSWLLIYAILTAVAWLR